MNNRPFSVAQRQSVLGVVLIFLTTLFKILRGFWVVGIYLLIQSPSSSSVLYISLGLVLLAVLVLGYSYLYYRRFLFHIDYKNEKFILHKGVFSSEEIAIAFDKIQQVYFKRSLLQRMVQVYSVTIETAGSKEDEVTIDAISKGDADLLSSVLMKAKTQKEPHEMEVVADFSNDPGSSWSHHLDLLTLFKIGISTNYLRGLALVLAFFSTIYNELSSVFEDYKEQLGGYYEQIPAMTDSIGFFLVLLVLLLVISIVITVLEVFIKYYGLKLTQTSENLELEMGLHTNTKVSLQPRRVQLMQVVTNPVQQRFNLYEARIALASSENTLQKKKIKIPGLGKETVEKVKSFLYSDVKNSFEKHFYPNKLLLLRGLMLLVIPVGLSLLFLLWQPYISLGWWLLIAGLFLLTGAVYQVYRFRSLQLVFTEEFLQKNQGVWNKKQEHLEIYKMQAITVKQPLWYRRRNLINVRFHTAGGDISFYGVSKEIIPYLNYILFKVASVKKRWM